MRELTRRLHRIYAWICIIERTRRGCEEGAVTSIERNVGWYDGGSDQAVRMPAHPRTRRRASPPPWHPRSVYPLNLGASKDFNRARARALKCRWAPFWSRPGHFQAAIRCRFRCLISTIRGPHLHPEALSPAPHISRSPPRLYTAPSSRSPRVGNVLLELPADPGSILRPPLRRR